jgi:nanoRNase/pAp phosphatase (c-di-AMP/oligoRNAs hydrolase)
MPGRKRKVAGVAPPVEGESEIKGMRATASAKALPASAKAKKVCANVSGEVLNGSVAKTGKKFVGGHVSAAGARIFYTNYIYTMTQLYN